MNAPQNLDEILRDHALWIDSKGYAGTKADLQNANLEGLDFGGKDLRKINLQNASLINANLSGAHLEMAELQGVNLTYAKLEDADLSYTDLSCTLGLISKQLGGCNLSGVKLPPTLTVENPSSEIADLSRSTKTIFIAMVLGCFYSALAIGTAKDVDLLTNSSSSKLPLIGVEMSTNNFYYVGPIILLAIYIYLHLYLQRFWERLSTLPAIFPDGRSLDEKVHPWVFLGFARSHFQKLNKRRPAFSRLQYCFCMILAYGLVPFTLYLFWGGFLTKQNMAGTELQILLIVTSVFCLFRFYFIARRTIRRRCQQVTEWSATIFMSCFVFLMLCFLSHYSMNGYRANLPEEVILEEKFWQSFYIQPNIPHSGPKYWVPFLLGVSGVASFADFNEQNISAPPDNWTGALLQLPLVKGAKLQHAHLRCVDAFDAFLVNADLRHADLENAILVNSDMRGADLTDAWLTGAMLYGANLSQANLFGAHLYEANFVNANLTNAFLINVDLNKANLRFAQLGSAKLFSAKLSNANLDNANLESADLSLAFLQNAICTGAKFHGASLSGADISGVNFSYADLRGVNFKDVKGWTNIFSLKLANVFFVTNAPNGFLKWATNKMGAVAIFDDNEWFKLMPAN